MNKYRQGFKLQNFYALADSKLAFFDTDCMCTCPQVQGMSYLWGAICCSKVCSDHSLEVPCSLLSFQRDSWNLWVPPAL